MKKSTLIIITLTAVSIISLGSVYADNIKSFAEGTSFQDHSKGKYGPPGAGGYGPPENLEKAENTPQANRTSTKKPLFQNVTEGTSFQGHSEGKYGHPGAGGYGPPEISQNSTTENSNNLK